MSLIKESEHLRIPFQHIKQGTENFTTLIGKGGYGPVYKGHLSLNALPTTVAVKQLQIINPSGQGLKEFLTEIQLLSRYKHQNLVPLVGFCEEADERFLIYDYAEHGSLDRYLKPTRVRCPFTWEQRIRICVDAARGLDHLHNHVAQNHRVIHRDIKSANILLDNNRNAMIADFGLSKIGRANEDDSYLITNACGTHGYCDPAYMRTGILTKESDVYSFGVVLFEVLCGRLCFINVDSHERFLAPLVQRYYKEDKLNLIIDRDLKNHMNSDSMKVFSEIAFQCLQDDRDQRPSMGLVLQRLENALKLLEMEEAPELLELEEALGLKKLVETLQMQQFEEAFEMEELEDALGLHKLVEILQMQQFEEVLEMQEIEEALGLYKLVETLQRHEFEEALKLHRAWELQKLVETLDLEIGESRTDYEVIKVIYDMPDSPLSYITRDKVYSHLSNGILIDKGNVWLSIDGDGKTQEMISAIKVVPLDGEYTILSEPGSRFSKVAEILLPHKAIQIKIRTQFLSSGVTYAAYLVCKPDHLEAREEFDYHKLLYTLNDKGKTYSSRPSKMEASESWMIELFQTTPLKRTADYNVTLHSWIGSPWVHNYGQSYLVFNGIQFLPIQKFEDRDEIEKSELMNLSTSNIIWDNRLPSDYKQIIYYSSIEMMKKPQRDVIFPTKEEAYLILLRGLLIKVTQQLHIWFWITKIDGKKCFMLPPTLLSYDKKSARLEQTTSKDSRIENVLHLLPSQLVGMRFEVPHGLFSTNSTYGCYLVYKMPQGGSTDETAVMMKVDDGNVFEGYKFTYLITPQIPFIGPDGLCGSSNPMNKLKTIELPRERKDGWLEVNLGNKSDIQWMNMQHDQQSDSYWQRESTLKSFLRPYISYNKLGNKEDKVSDNSFTLDPLCFTNITLYMWSSKLNPNAINWSPSFKTPGLIVQGIEFRPV